MQKIDSQTERNYRAQYELHRRAMVQGLKNAKRQNMRRMRERVEEERALSAGGYVMDWDADRFPNRASVVC